MTVHRYTALYSHTEAETFSASSFLEAAATADKLAKSKGAALNQHFNRVLQVIELYPTIPVQNHTGNRSTSHQADMPMESQWDR